MSWFVRSSESLVDRLAVRTQRGRLLLTASCLVAYAVFFLMTYESLGRTAGALVMLPILAAAYAFGLWGGLVVALVSVPLNTLMLGLLGYADLFSGSRVLMAVISVAFGIMSGAARSIAIRGRSSQELLDIAFDAAQDGLWDYRLPAGEVYFSPRWFTMLGYSPDELECSFSTWRGLLHPDDRERSLAEIEGVVSRGHEQFSLSFRLREASGSYRWILARGKTVEFDRDGRPMRLVGVHVDITELKRAEHELIRLAYNDPLTGLPNRKSFSERLEQLVAQAERASTDQVAAVLLINLDSFRDVNSSYGHNVGDELLNLVAHRLTSEIRRSDLLFRLGGDEFALVLTRIHRQTDAALVASNLIESFAAPLTVKGHAIYSSVSVGVAVYPNDGDNASELIKRAATALSRAKQERSTYRFYTSEMQSEAVRKMQIINDLRAAVEKEQFVLYYQPIVREDGSVCGAEALLRWQDPRRGLRAPGEFIGIAEETGLILQIGRWVLRQATQDAQVWRRKGLGDLSVSVNVAPRQLRHPTMLDDIESALEASRLPASLLHIELTEGSLVDPTDESAGRLRELRDQGISISIDDFGTGYSSMSYLKRLPVDTLKIDRSFVVGLPDQREDVSIVGAVITMAHGLGLGIVAEGVDSLEQVTFLRELGCDRYQGYYFSHPLCRKEFEAFVERQGRVTDELRGLRTVSGR